MAASHKRWPVVVLLALAVSAPWPLLQSAAWLKMVAAYSRTASLSRAISMTFDGKHPCRLCLLIQQSQTQERQHPRAVDPDNKLELGPPPEIPALTHPPLVPLPSSAAAEPVSRREPPSTPPPRAA